jgi:DNA mismatch endonuclease (patch repair protein)
MVDIVSAERRSEIMRKIRGKNTAPELTVRRFLQTSGLRFRLHRMDLPGTPDIVFSRKRICVFIHGCFWHGCRNCIDGTRKVKSNQQYWIQKIRTNQKRDRIKQKKLRDLGWKVFVIWECQIPETKQLTLLANRIKRVSLRKRIQSTEAHAEQ